MYLTERFWATVTYVVACLTGNIWTWNDGPYDAQQPILPGHSVQSLHPLHNEHGIGGGPVFKPPTGRKDPLPGSDFTCDYSNMPGWQSCSTPDDRSCWLRNPNTGKEFNIHTNYENIAPVGIHRFYNLEIVDLWYNADGRNFTQGKLVNGTYPGPWIQACWGDIVHINVTNKMAHNGTSIHWHGIRQNQTTQMDGVNGVTQCPIAPGDHFEYVWSAIQYGSSWYHSHYSVQYADGVAGPITIHGPTSSPFDEAKPPLLMSDWGHNSAFEAIYQNTRNLPALQQPSILLNGTGNVTRFFNGTPNKIEIPKIYTLHFEELKPNPKGGKRYLLRLINTSFDSTFIFSIDNHWMKVTSADFVPIHPYRNTSVLVGIGQRYNVIVEAKPDTVGNANPIPSDGNFWIRTWVADNCGVRGGSEGYEKTGILRYNRQSTSDPTSQQWPGIALRCSDETYSSLRPIVPWIVGKASNDKATQHFDLNIQPNGLPKPYPLSFFALEPTFAPGFNPLQINYSDPSFLHLNSSATSYPKQWVVIPEDFTSEDWVYFVMTINTPSAQVVGAHPMHLHGHDFAILQQEENMEYSPETFKPKRDNPPRRDVVLLPRKGFVVIAFKTDNPGNWLLHCHIATHASAGLAFQILERQGDADRLWPSEPGKSRVLTEARRVCTNWNNWYGNCTNWWPGVNQTSHHNPSCDAHGDPLHIFQDDSGI